MSMISCLYWGQKILIVTSLKRITFLGRLPDTLPATLESSWVSVMRPTLEVETHSCASTSKTWRGQPLVLTWSLNIHLTLPSNTVDSKPKASRTREYGSVSRISHMYYHSSGTGTMISLLYARAINLMLTLPFSIWWAAKFTVANSRTSSLRILSSLSGKNFSKEVHWPTKCGSITGFRWLRILTGQFISSDSKTFWPTPSMSSENFSNLSWE